MTITFLTVSKPTKGWAAEAVAHYRRFLSKYAQVSIDHVKPVSGDERPEPEIRDAECERLAGRLDTMRGAAVIVCDRSGTTSSSEEFSAVLRDVLDHHGGHAVVVIGGAYGLNGSILSRADLVWSFGRFTLPHDLAFIVAMEQIARAFSIDRGESYHK